MVYFINFNEKSKTVCYNTQDVKSGSSVTIYSSYLQALSEFTTGIFDTIDLSD